ncbi:MAG: carboxymuconolactone decarboxylase family protein, partial [Microthrixaceae bacterium]|nr:carboxymuconolactone decarboxylase family protein [Microthrixaceae bacterium]
MTFRPETAAPLNELAEVLLRGDNSLTRGERELIAARVSRLNGCQFCCDSHSTFAALQVDGGFDTVDCVLDEPDSAPVSSKMRALLAIAAQVQQGGKAVTS